MVNSFEATETTETTEKKPNIGGRLLESPQLTTGEIKQQHISVGLRLDPREAAEKAGTIFDNMVKRASGGDRSIMTWPLLGEWARVDHVKQKNCLASLVRKAGRQLIRSYGLFLVNVRGMGYRIEETGNELNICEGTYQQGVKTIHRSIVHAQAIRPDTLSTTQRSAVTQWVQTKANVLTFMRKG